MGLIESKTGRAVSANGNLGIDFAEVKTADIPQLGDPQEDFAVATSPETRELLRIKTPAIYIADNPPNRLIENTIDSFVETAEREFGGEQVPSPNDANIIIFSTNYWDNEWRMLPYHELYKKGTQGIAFTSVTQSPDGEDRAIFGRQYLGNAFSPYGAVLVGEPGDTVPREAYGDSMEIGLAGKVDFESNGLTQGNRDLAYRLIYLAGASHAKNHEYKVMTDKEFQDFWEKAGGDEGMATALIRACAMMDVDNLMPYVGLNSLRLKLGIRKRTGVKQFLSRGGLSEGQARTPEDKYGEWITASGENKGKLKRKHIVLAGGLNLALDGAVVLLPIGGEEVEPSVETLDNEMFKLTWAGIVSGELTSSDSQEFIDFIKDERRLAKALQEAPPDPYTVIHIHKWPTNWDSNKILMVDMNPRLIPNQAFQVSCGTWGLALQTRQALAEGLKVDEVRKKVLDGKEEELRTIGAYMTNHGVTFLVPRKPIQAEQFLVSEMKHTDGARLEFAREIPRR